MLVIGGALRESRELLGNLRRLGVRASLTRNPAKVSATLDRVPYDVIFLVLSPEHPDVLRSCAAIRRHPHGRQAAVLAYASAVNSISLDEIVASGVDDIVNGPIEPMQLEARLAVAELRLAERLEDASTAEALRRLEKAVETMQLGVTFTDVAGRIVYTNPAEAEMHGYEVEELLGRAASVLAPSDRRKPLKPRDLASLHHWHREAVNLRKDGSTFPVHLMSDVVSDAAGQPVGVVTTCEDISDRKRAERALQDSEERYALAAKGANDGLWDWDLTSDSFFVSSRWREIAGIPDDAESSPKSAWFDRVHPEDNALVTASLEAHLAGRETCLACEHRIRHADGTYRWVLVRGAAVRGDSGTPTRIAGSLTDITHRKLHDPVTGLPNRSLVLERVHQALNSVWQSSGRVFAVLALELDHLGHVAQSYGPSLADLLLSSASERLHTLLQQLTPASATEAVLAHLGGGRFAVLLDEIAETRSAGHVAAKLLEAVRRPFSIDGREIFTTASVGIVAGRADYARAEDILRDADTTVSQAKAAGGDTYLWFNTSMHAQALASLELEGDLRRALERDEFTVVYQPIVSLQTGKVTGLEALVRWPRGDGRVLLPGEFIPLAERTGLIVPLDRAVITKVCRQLRSWRPALNGNGPLTVSVNVSGLQFTRPDFTLEIDRILRSVGVYGRELKLEITESVILEHAIYAAELLAELRRLEITLSIDDFGTGYSSLSYLRRFEIDTLKIDRSFVSRMTASSDSGEIVKAVVSLGRNLGKDVVAEGLETRSQLQALRALGCHQAQGFLFARPLEPEQALTLITHNVESPFDVN